MITPNDFYLVYAKFDTLAGKPCALTHDDLLTRSEAVTAISAHFGRHIMATSQTLTVLRIQSDMPRQDVTDEILEEMYAWTDADFVAAAVDAWIDERREVA